MILTGMNKIIPFLVCFLCFYPARLFSFESDSLLCTNHIYDSSIKTVQLYKEGWNLSYPVIRLDSDEKLVLHFDLLGDKSESYYYTFLHCDKDWNRSDIISSVYLEGFPENALDDYESSFNTTVHYIHYKLTFPNDMISFKISGNYIIMVYPTGEPEKPVITYRFMISEDLAPVTVETHRARVNGDINTDQQIDFTVNTSALTINDTYNDVFSFILQNGRWNNAKRNLKPEFYGNSELKYSSLSDKNIFRGGNEYRFFDIKTIKYLSENVKRIDFHVSDYHVYLNPSEDREFKPYFYWQDFNGKYYIAIQEKKNPDIEADYVYVYFSLPSKYPAEGGKMYVSGALADWSFGTDNLMIYDLQNEAYECVMLLKQGWYNYEYFFMRGGDNSGVVSRFESNHYEAENDYTILVYFRNPRERYDRLIGTQTINTLNRLTY
jgi:hypothetical protein